MQLIRSKPYLTAAVAGGALLVGIALFAAISLMRPASKPIAAASSPTPTASPSPTLSPSASPTGTPAPVACPLTGLPVADPKLLKRQAVIVQIENHPDARPARNLNRADMVVEATVEGDATRFSAVFWCQSTVGLTGPVRSARYYNIDLWQDLHVLTVGYGASPGALDRFAAIGMPYVNGINGEWPSFQRVSGRFAPHNLYSNLEELRSLLGRNAALDALAARAGTLRSPFRFDPQATQPASRPARSISISTAWYWHFGWTWDGTLKAWRRSDAGAAVIDAASGAPVTARSIIVQRVSEEVVYGDPDPGGNARRLQHMVGSGGASLYLDGRAIALRWSRPSASAGTTFSYAANGQPIVLPPGRVWWEVVPLGGSVSDS